MEDIFIHQLKINNVRHLKDITIDIDNKERKHLILTGKNGSGKTSVLEALEKYIDGIVLQDILNKREYYHKLIKTKENYNKGLKEASDSVKIFNLKKAISGIESDINENKRLIDIFLGLEAPSLIAKMPIAYRANNFIFTICIDIW